MTTLEINKQKPESGETDIQWGGYKGSEPASHTPAAVPRRKRNWSGQHRGGVDLWLLAASGRTWMRVSQSPDVLPWMIYRGTLREWMFLLCVSVCVGVPLYVCVGKGSCVWESKGFCAFDGEGSLCCVIFVCVCVEYELRYYYSLHTSVFSDYFS